MKKTSLGIVLMLLLVGGVVALYKTVTGISDADTDIVLPPALLGDSIEVGDEDEIDLADIVAAIEEEESNDANNMIIADAVEDPNPQNTDIVDNQELEEAPEPVAEPQAPTPAPVPEPVAEPQAEPEPVAPEPTPTPVENEDTQDVDAQVAAEGSAEQDLGAILGELLGDLDAELEPSADQEQQPGPTPEPVAEPEPQAEPEPVAQAPSQNFPVYSNYNASTVKAAAAAGKTTVLFFHADWCPTCVALESSILDNISQLDNNLAVFKTDFDNTGLSESYGVSKQHTLVSLDVSGSVANSSRSIFSYQQLNGLVQ